MSHERLATLAAHAGSPQGPNAPLTAPIVQSTTYRFASAAELGAYNAGATQSGLYLYSRDENPTVRAAEQALAQLEGGERALLFASGMGAMTCALMGLLSAGDEVLCSAALYGGTYKLLRDVLGRFGVRMRRVAPERLASECAAPPAGAKVCLFESPTNPHLRVVDVAAVASTCRKSGLVSLLDSTFATPALQRPLALGVDLVMHSTTKYLNGHSDHLGGVLIGSSALIEKLWHLSVSLGAIMDAQVAYDLLRGLKTFAVRVERQCASSLRIARWLEGRPGVVRVYHPGLESHPDHALARRQMSSFGGMVTFSVGTKERAFRFYDRLGLIARAASLGGVESLCSLPILTSHTGFSAQELAETGVDEGMARLSIGLEDPDDLIADLEQALRGMEG
jgi:cystathionine beta-lyase/cystathionine gamma-synthase